MFYCLFIYLIDVLCSIIAIVNILARIINKLTSDIETALQTTMFCAAQAF